jgi:signal transduction histidine kinase
MISKIQGSTKFIIQLLNDLLDFSALESGKVKLDKQSADFESYMKNYILNTVIVAHQKDMEIYSEIQKDIPPILFDPMKIQQVLNNLTSNAIKFSHPGSNIYITVKADEKNVIVSVKDSGQGIPENEISQLFKPFQKTSVKSTGGEKSTGLGLVIARNIIRSHSGDISVESIVGKGSTFTFTLPISS